MRMDRLTSKFQMALADAQSLAVGRDPQRPAAEQRAGVVRLGEAEGDVQVPVLVEHLGVVGEVLGEALPAAVEGMSFPKAMRWGDGKNRWVRPVHWVLALHGAETLDLSLFGVRSGRTSAGHHRGQ